MWSKVGYGAKCASKLGPWSTVGPMARVFAGVTFGNWSSVGMYAIVLPGYKMTSHEYIPSGHIASVFGVHKLPFHDDKKGLFQMWDSVMGLNGPRIMTHEAYEYAELHRASLAQKLLEMLTDHFGELKTTAKA